MKFLENNALYVDFDYFQKYFKWPPTTKSNQNILIYHCYWAGTISWHHLLSIKSLLISQSPPFEVWVWMSKEDLAVNHTLVSELEGASCVRFCEYNLKDEVKDTSYEKYTDLLKGGSHRTPTNQSNGFRMLVLSKYGGIYFDMDVLFIRDLRQLCNVEFCYQWSNRPYANTAVMHAFKGSTNIKTLLKRGFKIGSLRPAHLLKFAILKDSLKDMVVFPSFLFDPVWISNDLKIKQNEYCNDAVDFFKSESVVKLADFFPYAYAYHWHNGWNYPFQEKTIAGQLYGEINLKYENMF